MRFDEFVGNKLARAKHPREATKYRDALSNPVGWATSMIKLRHSRKDPVGNLPRKLYQEDPGLRDLRDDKISVILETLLIENLLVFITR